MNLNFKGKRISGVMSVLPENLCYMEDEVADPDDPKTKRLKKIKIKEQKQVERKNFQGGNK